MPEHRSPKGRIRKKVLWRLSLTFVFILGLFFLATYFYIQKDIRQELDQKHAAVTSLFEELIAQRVILIQALVQQVSSKPELVQTFQAGQREALLRACRPHFANISSFHGLTHFYFHLPDGRNFLRVHSPDRFGDKVSRHTLLHARAKERVASGIELGPLGTFTLRVVVPWIVDEDLIGFVEMGEEIEGLIARMQQMAQVDFVVAIRKSALTQKDWANSRQSKLDIEAWHQFKDVVIFKQTRPGMAEQLAKLPPQDQGWQGKQVEISVDSRVYRGKRLNLHNASHQSVGDLLIFKDISTDLHNHRQLTLLVVGFYLLAGGVLFVSSYLILGRADRRLIATRGRLEDEIAKAQTANERLSREVEERCQAEAALKNARDELEEKVAVRTAQLNAQKDQMEGIVRSVDDSLIVTDAAGVVLVMNASAQRFANLEPARARGLSIEAVLNNPDLLFGISDTLARKKTGISFDFEVNEPGRPRPKVMQARTSVIAGGGGLVEGMIFLIQDVTRLREMDRLKSEFISTAAHELRTPMATILGFSELLLDQDGFSPDEQREFLGLIYDKADALSMLLDDLLDISRIESGRALDLHPEPWPAEELLEKTVQHYDKRERTHRFEMDLLDSTLPLLVDRGKFGQVMENLLSNAVKYSPQGGLVRVGGQRVEDGYMVTVSDQGIGMNEEQLSQVFDKFYRADNADTAIQGTGLGMTIVRHIIEAHGGRVWVESEPGQGTHVHFIVPAATA